MALVGRTGSAAGRGFRDDIATDVDAVPHCVHAGRRAGTWEHGNDCSEGERTGCNGPGDGLSKSGTEFGWAGRTVFLGLFGDADVCLCWFLYVF